MFATIITRDYVILTYNYSVLITKVKVIKMV